MQTLYSKIAQLLRDKSTRRRLSRIVSIISAIVVFVSVYSLVIPAITMEKKAYCGIEEHQHDESCYEKKLICGKEESEGHQHDDSCYEVTKELVCQIEEHQHSKEQGCYDENGNLICEKKEHVHGDSCYKEVKKLTCGKEESEGHHHTDACYEKVLVCKKEVHTHSADCYKTAEAKNTVSKEKTGGAEGSKSLKMRSWRDNNRYFQAVRNDWI